MIDKSLVKRRFKRSLKTYDNNAYAQKKMAVKLVKMLPERKYDSILEIGCATGILTKEIKNNIEFKEFSSNDIVEDSKKYIDKIITSNTFITGDIEEVELNGKYDLIISNACLQWCCDIEGVISKLYKALKQDGVLAVSVFGDENLKEIKEIFKITASNYLAAELKNNLKKYQNHIIEEETLIFDFNNLVDILKHLKATGANSVTPLKLTKNSLEKYADEYKARNSHNKKVMLTYNPVYIVLRK